MPAKAERDAASHQAWVITDSGTVAGFAVAARKSPGGAEILWIAVAVALRGRRHGTTLLGHFLDDLAAAGISVVEAKTLDRSSGYTPLRGHPGLLGIATASSTSTLSTRSPTGSRATRPQFTQPPSAQPGNNHLSHLHLTWTYLVTLALSIANSAT